MPYGLDNFYSAVRTARAKVKGDVDNVDKSIMNGRCWSRKVVRSDVVLRTGVRV